jgi:DNA-binding LacI/PurR family transcriptional regulator
LNSGVCVFLFVIADRLFHHTIHLNNWSEFLRPPLNATIGLIVPPIDHAIFAEVIQSFSGPIDRVGFTLLIASRDRAHVRK